jgi:23S rRNA (pseudouridine1915-N3)-methyltransferase
MAMRLHIIARGKIGRSPEGDLVDRYLKRISWPVRHSELPDKGGELPASDAPFKTIILDEKGEQLGSLELARLLEQWRDDGVRETRFLLGSADGFGDTERAGADRLIAFGKLTWPHLMARVMLAEQLFRATSIIAKHPYHREG